MTLIKLMVYRIAVKFLSNTHAYFAKLRQWIAEKDWQKWDQEIERDSENGKLDFLINEAKNEKEKGNLKDL